MGRSVLAKIGVFYPADPAGFVPSGIDSYIRSVLKFAPSDLEFTLFGSTSDLTCRPVGRLCTTPLGNHEVHHLPLVYSNPSAARNRIPLTVRYMSALRRALRAGQATAMHVLDFHRIEPVLLFGHDRRPKNLTTHMNVSNLRNRGTDIMWKHMPWLYERMERRLIRKFDRVFAVQQSVAETFAREHADIAERFVHLPPMVDTSVYRPPADDQSRRLMRVECVHEFGLPQSDRILTFVGRLDSSKDPMLLLAAFRIVARQFANAQIVIVGDGSLRSEVQQLSRTDGLSGRVTLLGARKPQEISKILQASDLFVMSSAYEGLPIAMLEALATGVPVVSTDVGDVSKVLKDGLNGYLCRARTADLLAAATVAALHRADTMRGAPCADSIANYRATTVLETIYENYRRQVHATAALAVG